MPAVGSRYAAPPVTRSLLDLPNGATATLNDANLPSTLVKGLTLIAGNKFTVSDPGADKLRLVADVASGLLSENYSNAPSLYCLVQAFCVLRI